MSLVQKLGNTGYTRFYKVLTGIKVNQETDEELEDKDMRTLFELKGGGRIVAVVPFGTSTEEYFGTLKVKYDDEEVNGKCKYNAANGANPFIINSDFQEMLKVNSNNRESNISGIYLKEIDRVVFPYYTYIKPLCDNQEFDTHYEYPVYMDRQIEEGYFKNGMSILASAEHTDTAVLLVYDLFG